MTTPINTSLISFLSDNVKPNVRNIIFNTLFYTQTSHRGNKPHVSGEIKENWKCNKNHFMIFVVAFLKFLPFFTAIAYGIIFFFFFLPCKMFSRSFNFQANFFYIYENSMWKEIYYKLFFPLHTQTQTNQQHTEKAFWLRCDEFPLELHKKRHKNK